MSRKYKRRMYPVVDRSNQYRFLAMTLIYNLAIVLFMVIAFFVPELYQLDDTTLSIDVRAAAADKILAAHTRVWPALLALICVIGLHSFRLFHRVVGPLYRFRWAFGRIRDGDLGFRVRLRRGDLLHKEEGALNAMIDSLAARIKDIQEGGEAASRSLACLEGQTGEIDGWNAEKEALLRAHRVRLDTFLAGARLFRLDKDKEG